MRRWQLLAWALIALVAAARAEEPSWPPAPVLELSPSEETPLSALLRAGKQAHPEAFLPLTRWCRAQGHNRHRLAKVALLYALRQVPEDAPQQTVARWLEALPVCERPRSYRWDAEALEVRPQEERLLAPGDRLLFFARPRAVWWLAPDGSLRPVPYEPGQMLQTYPWMEAVRAARADHAWVVRPDGGRQRVGVARWNEYEARPRLMPGTLVLPEYPWWHHTPVLAQLAAWLDGEVRW